jgi:hypothetical protein
MMATVSGGFDGDVNNNGVDTFCTGILHMHLNTLLVEVIQSRTFLLDYVSSGLALCACQFVADGWLSAI